MKDFCRYLQTVILAALLVVVVGFGTVHAFEAKLSGQVNQMMMWADDGNEDDFFVADNTNSSTRFRFTGSQPFGKIKAGFQIELEAQRNRSNELFIGQDNDGRFNWNDRWLNAYFDTPFGKFEIGKGDGAAKAVPEIDLSGTAVITYSGVTDTSGGFMFKNADGTDFGATIGQTRNNFGGLSRNERIRYNTPTFAGFWLAASMTNGEAWETSAWYAADFGGNKIAAAVGYIDGRKRAAYSQWSGAISWLMPFGLNLTASYGQRDFDLAGRDDANNYYFKVGYKWDIHAVSAEYGWTEDMRINGEDSSNWGLAYVITPWKGVEFYTAYRQFMLDAVVGSNPDDIRQAMLGTRIRF
jgi:predicted porin